MVLILKGYQFTFAPTKQGIADLFYKVLSLHGGELAGLAYEQAKTMVYQRPEKVTIKKTKKQKPWTAHQLTFHMRDERPESSPEDWEYARAVNALSGIMKKKKK